MNNDGTENQALIDAARKAMEIQNRTANLNGIPVHVAPDGNVRVMTDLLTEWDKRNPSPNRTTGTAILTELESFADHVNRNKVPESVIFAETSTLKLTAIYNYTKPSTEAITAAWCDHRAVYSAPKSHEWQTWTGAGGKFLKAEEFAELIEFNQADLSKAEGFPTPSQLVNMAREVRIDTRKVLGRKFNPTTGETTLTYEENHQEGTTKIFDRFQLGIPFFEAGQAFAVECRLKIRLEGMMPVFAFEIPDASRIQQEAFAAVRQKAKDLTGLPVYAGTPEK